MRKKFVLKEASLEAAISKLYLASRPCFLTPFHPPQIGGKEKTLQLTLHPSQGQQTIFSRSNYPLSSLLSFQSLKYACLAQNNLWLKSSHNPKWCLKGLTEAIWTESLGQNGIMKTQPGCWLLFKTAALMFKFLGFFRDNFHNIKENLHFTDWSFTEQLHYFVNLHVHNTLQSEVIISVIDKKYMFFGVT